jgi:hypothetical protein
MLKFTTSIILGSGYIYEVAVDVLFGHKLANRKF